MISQITNPATVRRVENLQRSLLYAGTDKCAPIINDFPDFFYIHRFSVLNDLHEYLSNQSIMTLPDVILIETDANGECFEFIKKLKKNPLWKDLIIVLLSSSRKKEWKLKALQLKIHDYYVLPFPTEHLIERINFLIKFKLVKPQLSVLKEAEISYKFPLGKKVFDIVVSFFLILLVSPILILTAIAIKLNSKGPVIYKSKRVGTGYNIFNFYKFRSMRVDADKQLTDLSNLNKYVSSAETDKRRPVFVKLGDDPRTTLVGKFIRKTSIDELPQLFNVLRGEMSLVGNRPLPLYEAEMLTSNEWSLRFMGPAGVTGLWQIKSRAKDVSERERKKFDNFYALKHSFWFDVQILLQTIPVILHKEE
ncbi:sugar transferase [Daejeonella lutea]|uniref:Sugar transferase involved in LPS biosynthesis (Colanic, teichoic acid) n=1 Tax=Daejeonella lutea TaxID=572036 RepID=A0A1T5EFI7_9SPHI|nr:sugar transferase [Daejeonella lutea]SKB82575.1 Sugar transferase involved in LPS biosynthesis (colanic, teichoic acid) [Daejeonella lutea]